MSKFVIPSTSDKPILFDIQYPENQEKPSLIIFLHGFKGFADWGQWPLMANELTKRGYAVLRMNFSHNGTTPEHPIDFVDLDAFGDNTFSQETADVQSVIDYVFSESSISSKVNLNQLFIAAHSRGGAITMITAAEDDRVKKIATLSGVSTLQRYTVEELAYWKNEGVVYIMNGRTNQNMPLRYTLAEDYLLNLSRFELSQVGPKIKQPYLVVHAENDETVSLDEGKKITSWVPNAILSVISNANHSFGGMHPYSKNKLPAHTMEAVDLMSDFFTENN